ncbi:hypothetical protein [Pseudoclavibacter sp. 8L]|uniref:hypothetical protein n=1 Tax=Pseudoclavibacter sp. 8L TaxID=2653162 RepID=UPI0012F23473|nr:hypothetical protein [Pseudoclavibacter sp. 8L]VXB90232.1 conserved membrane hypothetical protein [Pseudoclavibacter sp. 8L]
MWSQLTRGIRGKGMLAELSSAGIAVAVLVGVWTLYTIADITQFPYDGSAWAYAGMGAPALLGIWLIVELLSLPDTPDRPLLGRFMVRTMVVGPVLFTAAWLLGSLLLLVLTLTGGIVPELNETESPVAELLLNAFLTWLVGFAAVLCGALVGLVFVVLPVLSWRDPARAASINAEPAPKGSIARARLERMTFAGMLMLIFLAPSLWVSGESNARGRNAVEAFQNTWLAIVDFEPSWWDRYLWDVLWVLGMLSALLLVASVVAVVVMRKPQKSTSPKGRAADRGGE